MNKTIFHIISSREIGGGMENIFLEYSKIMQKHDFNLICLISQDFCHKKELERNNIKVEILNISGHLDILAAIKLHFLIKKHSPKLIFAHNGRAFATINIYNKIFSTANTKLVAVSHGGNIKRIINFDAIITVANHIYNKIIKANFKGFIANIYNGYQTLPSKQKQLEQSQFGENQTTTNLSTLTYGILSRLSVEKGVDLAIRSFKKFNDQVSQDCRLIIAGEGLESENLKQLTLNLNLQDKVEFIGWVKNKAEFFSQIDVFLQPAKKEPFGITILEAFNYKTLVIAANSDGPKEIIQDSYNGYLFEPSLEDSLFLTMQKVFLQGKQQSQLNQQIIKNAYQDLQEKFSYQIMEKNLINFLEML